MKAEDLYKACKKKEKQIIKELAFLNYAELIRVLNFINSIRR